jgi:hypothetical protein
MNPGDNKTFGRRGLARPVSQPPAAEPGNDSNPSGRASFLRSPLIKQLGGILIGVGILIGLQAVYFVSMKGFGRALDQHWRDNFGYPGLEDAYLATKHRDNALEQAHNHCKARTDFVQLGRAERNALEGFDGLYSGESALAKASPYVSCLTTQSPSRFCQPPHRTHLVAALTDYYRLISKVREERYLAATSPFAVEKAMLIHPGGGSPRGATGSPPSGQTDPRIVDGLRGLITDGYLSHRDLDGLPSALAGDLQGQLRTVKPARMACA